MQLQFDLNKYILLQNISFSFKPSILFLFKGFPTEEWVSAPDLGHTFYNLNNSQVYSRRLHLSYFDVSNFQQKIKTNPALLWGEGVLRYKEYYRVYRTVSCVLDWER